MGKLLHVVEFYKSGEVCIAVFNQKSKALLFMLDLVTNQYPHKYQPVIMDNQYVDINTGKTTNIEDL